jgi:hypothetical protein
MATTRDTIATILNNSETLRSLGLPADSIYQADTVDSPEQRPFIVIRWGDDETGMGKTTTRPFDLWVYDEFGDYNRADQIARAAAAELVALEQVPTDTGWIMSVLDRRKGGDLADEGFDALVVPYHLAAVANGV